MLIYFASFFENILNYLVQVFRIIINVPKPNQINLSNANEIIDNRIVFNLVLVLHILYFFLLNYCIDADRIDNFMYKKAIQINDVPHGTYKYLVSIYTNWRPRSGTRSSIFLQLHGNLSKNTMFYYLHNPYLPHRRLFERGDISFFIINTANPVGEIQNLTIGHDNSVDSSWFLSKVLVKDLQTNKSYRFLAHCWLLGDKIDESKFKSVINLEPVDPSYVEPFAERVFEWVLRCYRERPLTSFFYLNLITHQSRITRLNTTYFYIVLLMLVNMMYFNIKTQTLLYAVVTSSIKSIVSFNVLLVLQYVFSFECFTSLYPSKKQFRIRTIVNMIFLILYLIQVFFLLVYSSIYKDDVQSTLYWLGLFFLGLAQSEFLYSFIAAFSKATFYTFFSKDPFEAEGARILLTYRNKF